MKLKTASKMPTKHSIAVSHTEENAVLSDQASALAIALQLPHVPPSQQDQFATLLLYRENGLQIQLKPDRPTGKPLVLCVNFLSNSLQYRTQHGGGTKQALARAVGIKPGIRPNILDATAGLGIDSFLLASLGCKVNMLERSPLLYALLQDGLRRAALSPEISKKIISNLTLVKCDSISFMKNEARSPKPETIYLDPMYPHSSKSALNKLEMRIIRNCVGDDTDSDELLESALCYAKKRVVVKRPKTAPLLTDHAPSHTIKMKNSRFDVYMI